MSVRLGFYALAWLSTGTQKQVQSGRIACRVFCESNDAMLGHAWDVGHVGVRLQLGRYELISRAVSFEARNGGCGSCAGRFTSKPRLGL
jgi:hypothetical protein